MAKFRPVFGATGLTLYGVLLRGDLAYNVIADAYEQLDTNARDEYAVALTEMPPGSGIYIGDVPSGAAFAAGRPHIMGVYTQAGASPDASDARSGGERVGPDDANVTHVTGNPATLIDPDTLNRVQIGPVVTGAQTAGQIGNPLRLEQFEHSAKTHLVEARDTSGSAIDLLGRTLRIKVETVGIPKNEDGTGGQSPQAVITIEDGDITVEGAGNNYFRFSVTGAQAESLTRRRYNWRLWDVIADEVLAHGAYVIERATDNQA